jgi:hypothetical protein
LGLFCFLLIFVCLSNWRKIQPMKNLIFLSSIILVLSLSSCGKAAEDREAMYARAKVFQDSIANVLKTAMDAAAAPAPGMAPAAVITNTAQTPAAPSATNK